MKGGGMEERMTAAAATTTTTTISKQNKKERKKERKREREKEKEPEKVVVVAVVGHNCQECGQLGWALDIFQLICIDVGQDEQHPPNV